MIKAGCAKNVGKESKVKTPVGKKCLLKTIALSEDEKEEAIKSSRGRAQSWWRVSQAWEARVECQWHGKVAWKWMKRTSTNKETHQKPTTITQKPHRRFSEAKYHRWEFLTFDYWFSSNINEANRTVLNFVFYFFYDKISPAQKSTNPLTVNKNKKICIKNI